MVDINNTFGFELLQKLYQEEIHKKEDLIILLIHWYLIKSGFRCIGIGDEKIFDASVKGSELLPKEWNTRPNYALRYIISGKLYILLGIRSDADLLLNLLKYEDDSISNIQFPIEGTISMLHGPLEVVIPSYQIILRSIQSDLLGPIYSGNTNITNEATTQTIASDNERETPRHNDADPLRERIPTSRRPINWDQFDPANPARVGARDLNPFGQGGGMLFDPFNDRAFGRVPDIGLGVPGRLPPGAIPPGARFDPFGPPDLNQNGPYRRRPDDDHLPPPPGYDDMFM